MIDQLEVRLRTFFESQGFNQATPIQEQIFGPILAKQDLLALSPTGTGKTLAYLLPILQSIKPDHSLQAVIFAPSQELAQQIFDLAETWCQQVEITCLNLVGGANMRRQIERLKSKPELVVATPGRFNELLKQSAKLKVHTVERIIYDEADYLFAPGQSIIQDLEMIEKRMMRDVHRVYCSASKSQALLDYLALKHPQLAFIEVDPKQTPNQTEHYYLLTANRDKITDLKRLAQVDDMQALVFFDQISSLERAATKLIYENQQVVMLHSQLTTQERAIALQAFRQAKATYLLTTDLAARGLDIEGIPYVIQFDPAKDLTTYQHRAGRTGRMGQEGCVVSLVNQQEAQNLLLLLGDSDFEIEERILFDRHLVKEKPQVEKKDPIKKTNSPVSKSVSRPAQPKKRKKNRHRLQKNIGKPKKKD